MIEYLLAQDAKPDIGDPTFLQILNIIANKYKMPILDSKTQNEINQQENQIDHLTQRITELETQIKGSNDPTQKGELQSTIDGLKTTVDSIQKDNTDLKSGKSTGPSTDASTGTTTTKTCNDDDPNIKSLGTIDSEPICYDKKNNKTL